jgi:hypothetical protein
MDNMVTYRHEGDDLVIRLSPMAKVSLVEMLEMLDLDAFAIVPEDKEILAETKDQIMKAAGH